MLLFSNKRGLTSMKTTNAFKIALLMLFTVVLASNVFAADPYDGVNRIGTFYQYTNTYQYNYETNFQQGNYYDYIAPARAGGWFGDSTEWIVGLRSPMYNAVPPVHYTNYYQPVCGSQCWFGGNYGYPRATASQFPYRSRSGGIYGY